MSIIFGETSLKGIRESRPKIDGDDQYLHESKIVNKVVSSYQREDGDKYYRCGEIVSVVDPPCNYVIFMFDGHRTFQIRVKYTSQVMNCAEEIADAVHLHSSTVVPVGNVTEAESDGADHAAEAELDVGQMFGIPTLELRPEYQSFSMELSWIVNRIEGDVCFCSVIDPENIINGEVQYTIGDVRRWAFLF